MDYFFDVPVDLGDVLIEFRHDLSIGPVVVDAPEDPPSLIEEALFPGDSGDRLDQLEAVTELKGLLPGTVWRVLAKTVDLLVVGVIVIGFGSFFDSYLWGLFWGYSWLAVSDWFHSPGKSIFRMKVIDRHSLANCTLGQSIKRNAPLLLVYLPHRIHRGVLGMDRQEYFEEFTVLSLVLGVLGICWLILALSEISSDRLRRRPGDIFAGTVVIWTKSESKIRRPLTRPSSWLESGEPPG